MLLFLSMPINTKDPELLKTRLKISKKIAHKLFLNDISCVSPGQFGYDMIEVLEDKNEIKTDFSFWETYCINFLEKSDSVYFLLLDGFEHSKGMKTEYLYVTNKLDIPYMFIDYINGEVVEASEEKIDLFKSVALG